MAFADEDILQFDGTTWSLFFDGSDVGLPDRCGCICLLQSGCGYDPDVIRRERHAGRGDIYAQGYRRFDATSLGSTTAGTFSMYFNGVDVGLSASAENIDALDVLPDGQGADLDHRQSGR